MNLHLSGDTAPLEYIDSHTGGEPTRVVIAGGPDLGSGPLSERVEIFRHHHDWLRTALVTEPRGSEVMVGALLVPPSKPEAIAGVIFFNNVGYLGMCGHGTIGVVATLDFLGKISVGTYLLEAPAGDVQIELWEDGRASFRNVPSYRYQAGVTLKTQSFGDLVGDIAYGGNWFFITADHGESIELANLPRLTALSQEIKQALSAEGITGSEGRLIDHIQLVNDGPFDGNDFDSQNFILCPGGEYDRSPCGTGTSARLACLAAEGRLAPEQTWRQGSLIGSVFEGSYEAEGNRIIPTITGNAYVTARSQLITSPGDPYTYGIRTQTQQQDERLPRE